MFSLLALSLAPSAVAAPHLVVEHSDAYYVAAHPPAGANEAFLAGSTVLGDHHDEYDHMQVRELTATSMWPLRVGDELRSWVTDDRFVACTVRRFIAEVPGAAGKAELPSYGVDRAVFLAELSCEEPVEPVSWLVAPGDPVPYRPVPRPAEEAHRERVAQVLQASSAYVDAVAGLRAQAGEREVAHNREVERVDTRAGHLLVETGLLYTGQGDVSCGNDDLVMPYAAVVRDGPQPELLSFRVFGDDEVPAGVIDIDRDGGLEWVVYGTIGDSVRIDREEETVARGDYIWWSYCGC